MSKNRKIETKNPFEKELDEALFRFVDDEMDYNMSQKEIVQTIENHTLDAIKRVEEMRKSSGQL